MRIPIKAICELKRIRKDGTSLIFLQYFHDGVHRIFLNTGIAIPPDQWDKRKECVKQTLSLKYGTAEKVNREIDRQLALARDLILWTRDQQLGEPGAFIKEKYAPDLKIDDLNRQFTQANPEFIPQSRLKKEGFFVELQNYVLSKQKKVSPATITVFNNMIGHFTAFQKHREKPITFAQLDFQFYEDLVDFLTHDYLQPRKKTPVRGLRTNTIGKTIHQFRIFILDRVKRKIIPPIDLSDYKIPTEDTDAIYLDHYEIGKLYHLDLTERPDLIPARNLFVLGCLTGLRFSDYSTLKPEDLHQDMLYKRQQKSFHPVVIPLRKEAKEIFTEQFKQEIPNICNAQFNKNIKEIAKLAGLNQTIKFSYKKGNKTVEIKRPKFGWITSHTARRSFCTNEFLAGTPVFLIMKISGHKREKDFYKYIRVDPQEAAQKIKQLWMERGDLEVFKDPAKKVINMIV